jgi:uncharacterized RDD family membrane protein YckC
MTTGAEDDDPPLIASTAAEPQIPAGAGFVRRILATVVDMVLFVALSTPLMLPVASSVAWTTDPQHIDKLAGELTDPSWLSHVYAILGLWIALWWCYFVVGWGLIGATPGKRLLGLKVVDHKGRHPIGASRAVLRIVAYMVSSLTLCWGHLLVIFRSDHRALHDILAGTRVVRRK